jgi:hypothetical protein
MTPPLTREELAAERAAWHERDEKRKAEARRLDEKRQAARKARSEHPFRRGLNYGRIDRSNDYLPPRDHEWQ